MTSSNHAGTSGGLTRSPCSPPSRSSKYRASPGSPTANASVAPARYGPCSRAAAVADHETDERGDEDRDEQDDDEGEPLELLEHHGGGVAGDGHEPAVTEADLPVDAGQERQAGDRRHVVGHRRHLRDAERVERLDEQHDADERRQHEQAVLQERRARPQAPQAGAGSGEGRRLRSGRDAACLRSLRSRCRSSRATWRRRCRLRVPCQTLRATELENSPPGLSRRTASRMTSADSVASDDSR